MKKTYYTKVIKVNNFLMLQYEVKYYNQHITQDIKNE